MTRSAAPKDADPSQPEGRHPMDEIDPHAPQGIEALDGPAAEDRPTLDAARMAASAERAADFLKSLGHGQRLMILCHLSQGERTVGELESLLGARQAAVSQQLARLRLEGLVRTRREGKSVRYSLADGKAGRLLGLLYEMFCDAG